MAAFGCARTQLQPVDAPSPDDLAVVVKPTAYGTNHKPPADADAPKQTAANRSLLARLLEDVEGTAAETVRNGYCPGSIDAGRAVFLRHRDVGVGVAAVIVDLASGKEWTYSPPTGKLLEAYVAPGTGWLITVVLDHDWNGDGKLESIHGLAWRHLNSSISVPCLVPLGTRISPSGDDFPTTWAVSLTRPEFRVKLEPKAVSQRSAILVRGEGQAVTESTVDGQVSTKLQSCVAVLDDGELAWKCGSKVESLAHGVWFPSCSEDTSAPVCAQLIELATVRYVPGRGFAVFDEQKWTLSFETMHDAHSLEASNTWVINRGGGLVKMSGAKTKHVEFNYSALSVYVTKQEQWIGTTRGLVRRTPDTEQLLLAGHPVEHVWGRAPHAIWASSGARLFQWNGTRWRVAATFDGAQITGLWGHGAHPYVAATWGGSSKQALLYRWQRGKATPILRIPSGARVEGDDDGNLLILHPKGLDKLGLRVRTPQALVGTRLRH